MTDANELQFMRRAIDSAKHSTPEDERPHPLVGAVAVKNGRELGRAYRCETGSGDHAEEGLLEKKLSETGVVGSTVYTTLEPCCAERGLGRTHCTTLLTERRVSRVVIGMLDPDQRITGKGILLLRQHNIAVDLFPPNLMAELEELNRKFIRAKQRESSDLLSRITLHEGREELYTEIITTINRVDGLQNGSKTILLTGLHGESGARRPEIQPSNPVLARFDEEMLRRARSSMWYVRELYNITSKDRLEVIIRRIGNAGQAEGYEVRAFCVKGAIPQFRPLAIGNDDLFLALDDPTFYRVRAGVHIRGRGFTNLAKEHFEQLWADPRLFKLRTAMGQDEGQIRLLTQEITRLNNSEII